MRKEYTRHPNCQCSICEKAIYKRPAIIAGTKSGLIFCGMNCYGKHNRKSFPCPVCETEILAGKNSATCSRACANKQKTGQPYKTLGRPIKDFVKSRHAVRSRLIDTGRIEKCEDCGYDEILPVIQVHHIVERCEGGSDDPTNLKFLCPTCHAVEHYRRKQIKKINR